MAAKPGATIDDWGPAVSSTADTQGTADFDTGPAEGQYVLLWIPDLRPPTRNRKWGPPEYRHLTHEMRDPGPRARGPQAQGTRGRGCRGTEGRGRERSPADQARTPEGRYAQASMERPGRAIAGQAVLRLTRVV